MCYRPGIAVHALWSHPAVGMYFPGVLPAPGDHRCVDSPHVLVFVCRHFGQDDVKLGARAFVGEQDGERAAIETRSAYLCEHLPTVGHSKEQRLAAHPASQIK